MVISFDFNASCQFWSSIYHKSDLVALLDGSWMPGTSQGGVGGIFRTGKKKLCMLFTGPTQCWESLEAEIESLRWCLHIWVMHFFGQSIIIGSDSSKLVEEFENFNVLRDSSSKTGAMLLDICGSSSLSGLGNAKIVHVPRHLNSEAHELAKRGCKGFVLDFRWFL